MVTKQSLQQHTSTSYSQYVWLCVCTHVCVPCACVCVCVRVGESVCVCVVYVYICCHWQKRSLYSHLHSGVGMQMRYGACQDETIPIKTWSRHVMSEYAAISNLRSVPDDWIISEILWYLLYFITKVSTINPRRIRKIQAHSQFKESCYRVIPGHRNWQIETAIWNLAGFFTVGLEPRWQRFGRFLNDL